MPEDIRSRHAARRAARYGAAAIAALALSALPLWTALSLTEPDARERTARLWQPPAEPWAATGTPEQRTGRFVPEQPATVQQPQAVLLLRPAGD